MLSTAPELSAVLRPLALWPLLERRVGAADVFFLFFLHPGGRRRRAVVAVDKASVPAVPGVGGGASSELPSISDSMDCGGS